MPPTCRPQAKKREKKKNAAKEPVLEPSKENKANSATGEVGGKRDAMAVPRAEGVSSKGKVEGIAMQRPHVLGDKVGWSSALWVV